MGASEDGLKSEDGNSAGLRTKGMQNRTGVFRYLLSSDVVVFLLPCLPWSEEGKSASSEPPRISKQTGQMAAILDFRQLP